MQMNYHYFQKEKHSQQHGLKPHQENGDYDENKVFNYVYQCVGQPVVESVMPGAL